MGMIKIVSNASALPRAAGKAEVNNGERHERTGGHEQCGEQWIHVPGEREGNGEGIVGDGKRDHGAGGMAALGGDVEQGTHAAKSAAEEIESGLLLEQTAIDGGRATHPSFIDGERIVGAVAKIEGVVFIERADFGGLLERRKLGETVAGPNTQAVCHGRYLALTIPAENEEVIMTGAQEVQFLASVVAGGLAEAENGERFSVLREKTIGSRGG